RESGAASRESTDRDRECERAEELEREERSAQRGLGPGRYGVTAVRPCFRTERVQRPPRDEWNRAGMVRVDVPLRRVVAGIDLDEREAGGRLRPEVLVVDGRGAEERALESVEAAV